MALTTDDRETVRLIAREVAEQVGDKLADVQGRMVADLIEHHAKTCPLVLSWYGSKRLLVGIGVGLSIASGAGGVVGAMIGKLLM